MYASMYMYPSLPGKVKTRNPEEFLDANDLVLIAEFLVELERKFQAWKQNQS